MSSEQQSSISITLEAAPVVSYAMAHNEISVISRLVIDDVPAEVRGAVLRFGIADATGPLSESHDLILDLPAGRPTVLTDLRVVLAPAVMLQVEEQRPGVIRAQLEIDGRVGAECDARVQVLAAHQWVSFPLALGLEMLAAHVMPNHPAIVELMGEVGDRLLAMTGSPSLQGYQAGPERVDQIVQAVYEAMQARGIRYSEPPASWADVGQKVRTPGEVLQDRIGTCLDTVVVMAAALEQTGIRPLIWVVKGHAFLGYWREESSLGSTAQTDVADVVNRIDLGQIRLVETTALTARDQPIPFAETHQLPYTGYLTGDLDRVYGVTDVYQARRDKIVPLPARTRDDDGGVRVSVYTPPALPTPQIVMPETPSSPATSARSAVTEPARVTQWKNALLDLSLRNRLVNFTARSGLSLAVPGDRLGELEDVLHQGAAVSLRASDDIAAIERERGIRAGKDLPVDQLVDLLASRRTIYADVTEAAYNTRLRGLAHKARTILEETGANNLYLALGSLVWELDGRPLRSPLILIPVTLKAAARGGRYRIVLDDAGSSTPNYCLIEKLRQVHGLNIPGLADPVLDSAGIDLDAAFQATRTAIAERGLSFRVEQTADLAVLQFAKFRLWKDLDENWATFTHNPLVNHLVRTPTEAFVDRVEGTAVHDLEELAEQCPVPADSSQLKAVAEAVAGRTFVLEGPPGTGKSQTITNLLTQAVAKGKRVLFVAEKRAALDVVQKRLDSVGMGPLSLDLHDKGSSPAAVREQIKRALEHTVATDHQGLSAKLDELRSARRGLTRYAFNLHDRNAVGFSLYTARDAALSIGDDVAALSIPPAFLGSTGPEALSRLRRLLGELPDLAYQARPQPHHPWAFIDDAGAGAPDVEAVLHAARRFDTALQEIPRHAPLADVLTAVQIPDNLRILAALLNNATPLGVLDETRTPGWNQAADTVRREVAAFAAIAHPGLDLVTPSVLDLPLADIHSAAQAAAGSGFFGRKKRLLAVLDRLSPALRPGVQVAPKRLTELTGALMVLHDGVQRLAANVQTIPGLVLALSWNPLTEEGRTVLERRIQWLRWAGATVDPGNPDPAWARFAVPLRDLLAKDIRVDPAPIGNAAAAAEEFLDACRISSAAVAEWAGDVGLMARWEASRPERALGDEHLGSLRRWLALVAHIEPLRGERLTEARSAILRGELSPDDAVRAFELGVAQASVGERCRNTGLDTFDATVHERGISRFVAAAGAVREHLTSVVPQQVLRSRSFDPGATGGKVGLLQRQLSRQRGGLKVRELMTQFGDLITQALPCVLVSPDSVARFFPATADLFDIVVFDEASQVRVADAVGAMGRARSVVVVGDSKQMPPTSFAESSFTSGDPDTEGVGDAVEDEESILSECVQARVARHRLTWHYRSQDESLIAFSNHHYYDGSLSSFPAPVAGGPGTETGISLVRVDGRFHRSGKGALLRTNPVEAEAVVAEIRRRFGASSDVLPSLGVVTFNQQQRAYIEGLLRDSNNPRIIEALDDATEGLFVKNLENVQGDERDVILFSTAFSVNERGVLPLNFGPLNRNGGERRLNVAVTRARRQVVVFSSFDPAQLRAEETSSVGVKNLRTYLDMAADGASALPQNPRRRALPDRHREQIAEALRARGLAVRTDVGLSEFKIDLTIGDPAAPDTPLVAVLLDGPAWAARLTAHDRDGLPVEVLSGLLRWPAVERVWLPNWLADPETVLDRLVKVTEQAATPTDASDTLDAVEEPVTQRPIDTRTPVEPIAHGVAHQPRTVDEPPSQTRHPQRIAAAANGLVGNGTPDRARTAPPAVFVPWAAKPLGSVDVLDELPAPSAVAKVAAALTDVVAAEGPVHVDRLTKLVAGAFGLGRVVESRRTAILRHLPRTLRKDDAEPVVWPTDVTPDEWTGFRRTPQGTDRPLEHVPLREIVNAMAASARAAAGMPTVELQREVLGVFGGRRLTAGITERLDAALALGVKSERLRIERTGIVVAV